MRCSGDVPLGCPRDGGGPQGSQLGTQARRQKPVDAVESGKSGSFDAGNGCARRDVQHHCHGHGLVVIE
jgi:hypothetical protein